MERDETAMREILFRGISTHTLTWSVTCACFFKSSGRRISTHTLTWSVTYDKSERTVSYYISTHTLTWSVTIYI